MSKYLAIIALGIVTIAYGQSKTVDRILAQVNDDIITLSDLNREMADIRQDLSTKFSGDQLEQEIKRVQKDVLDELIKQKLLLQKANELGFGAGADVQVSAAIERIRKQYNIKDMEEFERTLAQQGQTMAAFRERLRKNIISQSVVQEFVGSRITLLTQEIERYYKDHAAEYTTPEEVSLSEIIISIEGSASETEAKAKEIQGKVRQGESFATLASQYSKGTTANKGGSIGSYIKEKLNPEIANAIASVKEGDVTPVMKIKEGFVIYRVDTRKPARVRPLDELRDEIKGRLYEQKFNPEFERFVAQLKEDAYIQIFGEAK